MLLLTTPHRSYEMGEMVDGETVSSTAAYCHHSVTHRLACTNLDTGQVAYVSVWTHLCFI